MHYACDWYFSIATFSRLRTKGYEAIFTISIEPGVCVCINQTRMTIGRVAFPCLVIVVGEQKCRVCALFHVLTQTV